MRSINCQHIDGNYRCRVHQAPRLIRWMMPKGRPVCIYVAATLAEEPAVCEDQVRYVKPPIPGCRP